LQVGERSSGGLPEAVVSFLETGRSLYRSLSPSPNSSRISCSTLRRISGQLSGTYPAVRRTLVGMGPFPRTWKRWPQSQERAG